MNDLNQTLLDIFTELKNCELVVTKTANDKTITEFSNKLNEAVRDDDTGNNVGDFVRFLYKRDRRSFYNYLKITELQHLTLLTDGQALINVLDIKGLISITYRYRQKDFVVTKDAWSSDKLETVNNVNNVNRQNQQCYPQNVQGSPGNHWGGANKSGAYNVRDILGSNTQNTHNGKNGNASQSNQQKTEYKPKTKNVIIPNNTNDFPVLNGKPPQLTPVSLDKYADMVKSARRHNSAVVSLRDEAIDDDEKPDARQQLNDAQW